MNAKTYRITIITPEWTIHLDGTDKTKLQRGARRMIKSMNLKNAEMSELQVSEIPQTFYTWTSI